MQTRLDMQKQEYEAAIQRHLTFIDQVQRCSSKAIYLPFINQFNLKFQFIVN